jgi:hypothetical protein
MTAITPGSLTRIGQHAVLGADAVQWILYMPKRADYPLSWNPTLKKLRPLAFCKNRAALMGAIGEKGLVLTPRAPYFEPRKAASEPADACWMDE